KLLREHAIVEAPAALVADAIARIDSDRRALVLVPEMGEESDAQRGIAACDAGAARGIARVFVVADFDAGLRVGRRDSVDDGFRAAVVYVVERRNDGDLRRQEPYLDAALLRRGRLAEPEEDGAHGRHSYLGIALLELGNDVLTRWPRDRDPVAGDRELAGIGLRQHEHRHRRRVLREHDLEPLQSALRRDDADRDLARAADEGRSGDFDGRAGSFARVDPDQDAADDQGDEDDECFPHSARLYRQLA